MNVELKFLTLWNSIATGIELSVWRLALMNVLPIKLNILQIKLAYYFYFSHLILLWSSKFCRLLGKCPSKSNAVYRSIYCMQYIDQYTARFMHSKPQMLDNCNCSISVFMLICCRYVKINMICVQFILSTWKWLNLTHWWLVVININFFRRLMKTE